MFFIMLSKFRVKILQNIYIYKLRLCVLRHESFMKTNLDYNYQFIGYRLVAT